MGTHEDVHTHDFGSAVRCRLPRGVPSKRNHIILFFPNVLLLTVYCFPRKQVSCQLSPTNSSPAVATPRARLAVDYLFLADATATAVEVPVELEGSSRSTITAVLGVYSTDDTALDATSLVAAYWSPGESGTRSVTISIQPLFYPKDKGRRRSVVVRITTVSNAIINSSEAAALISLDPNVPRFSFKPNTAAYREKQNSTPQVDILLESGKLTDAATLRYKFNSVSEADLPPFLRPGGSSGFLQIKADAGGGAAANGTVVGRIAVPIEWSEVPEDAQYRVALKLQRVSWRLDC